LVELVGGRGRLVIESLDCVVEGLVNDGVQTGQEAVAMVRPEAVSVSCEAGSGIRARVEEVVYLGELVSLKLRIPNGQEMWCRRLAKEQWPSREDVWVTWDAKDLRILPVSGGETQEKGEKV